MRRCSEIVGIEAFWHYVPVCGLLKLFVAATASALALSDFTLNGTPGVSGNVAWCVPLSGECGFTATPLPAALCLFGSGVLALAGFAWRRRGKVSL
jgi:PEP-CTERM motif